MKIKSLKINNFGKLKEKDINLNNNINLIYGKNESGKSTMLKFITSMLYGINRNKAGNYTSDYERYTPWEQSDFSGKISYELDNGETYEIYRDFTKKSPKIFNENMEEITKKYSIDKTKGSRFFQEQTGVDEELFLSTIVSEQQGVKLEEKKQSNMIQKITNIIGTGENNISYQNTINNLNKKITNEIGTKNTKEKPINILEKRKKELEEELKYIENFNNEKYAMEETKKEEELLIKEKEIQIEFAKKIQELENKQIIEKEKIKISKEIEKEKEEEILELKEKLNKIENPNIKKINKKLNIILIIAILILSIIISVIIKPIIPKIIIGVIAVIIETVIITKLIKKIKNNKEIITKINTKKININKEIKNAEKILTEKIEENQSKENNIILNYNNEKQKINLLYKDKINYKEIEKINKTNNINEEVKNIEKIINDSKLNIHRIELDEKNINPKLEELSKKIEELENTNEELNELIFQGKAIAMAKDNIEQAYMEMKNNISPKFTEKLSKAINKISNEKYSKVRLSDEFGLIVENEKGDYVPIAALSIGTIDQLYLSLRLATIDDISQEKLPIILDESFAYFDDNRLENLLKFFKENYEERQIIIFTCTHREEEIMKRNNYNYKLIEL